MPFFRKTEISDVELADTARIYHGIIRLTDIKLELK